MQPVDATPRLSLTPGIPTYSQARAFMKAVQGVAFTTFWSMYSQIWDMVGNPQENMDWTAPEEWIPQRLTGEEQAVALKIWRDTNHVVNPRHTRGCYYFTSKHTLLEQNPSGLYEITAAGKEFLGSHAGDLSAQIDSTEGLLTLLQIVSELGPARRSDLLPAYAEFCLSHTTYQSSAVHTSSLYDRLVNLKERGLIERRSNYYEITEAGTKYLIQNAMRIIGRSVTSEQTRLKNTAQTINKAARQHLVEFLSKMDPFKFEHLIRLLLQEMGYDNVQVTRRSNDGGVDVVAEIELGISSIKEVVQVKRKSGTVNRPVLDALRGVLHRFGAQRGTIITLGKVATGAKKAAFEPGGAPITLIDGERLLDLLMQHEIGLARKTVDFYEFDDSKLLQFADQPAEEEER